MLDILALTVPVYAAIAVGHLATRAGLVTRPDMRVLGTFVVNFALPCLLFLAVASRPLGEILNGTYVGAYAAGSLATFAVAVLYARKVERTGMTEGAFYAMAMACPNSGFIGYPVLLLTLPSVAGVVLGLQMIVENLLTIPLVLALAEHGRGAGGSWQRQVLGALRRLLRNPMVDGILLGLVFSVFSLPVPAVVNRTADLFARASTAVALFAVGGLLVGVSLHGMLRQLTATTVGKLLVHPLLVAVALWLLLRAGAAPLPPELQAALILSAAMPVFTVYPVLAARFGQEKLASAGLLASTATSFVTLSLLLVTLRPVTGA